jgi:hypothetical protein
VVVVVGKVPEEVRVPWQKYVELLSRLDAAVHGSCPHEADLANEVLDLVRSWQQARVVPQVDGQLELPLEWDETSGGR